MARRVKLADIVPGAPATAWTVRTPETLEKILGALREGCTRRAACAVAGIDQGTLIDWAKSDADVSNAILCAEDACEAKMTSSLTKAAETDWRAAESWLKRRRREDYGDNILTSLQGKTDEQLANIIATGGIGGIGVMGAADSPTVDSAEPKVVIQVIYADDPSTTSRSNPQG